MNLKGKTRNDVCKDLELSYSTFTDWLVGNVYPRIDKIEMLARYFGVDKSDLIEDKLQDTSKHNPEYTRLTNLCNIGFKSIMTWTEDSFYKEYETIVLREYFSNLLYQYKDILEVLNNAKHYWNGSKDELIEFYQKQDPKITEKQVKELFLKQKLDDKLLFTSKLVTNLPQYISHYEDKYENSTDLSSDEKIKLFTISAQKEKD
jgi:transcriptional regulator with XRE-family HTH domain